VLDPECRIAPAKKLIEAGADKKLGAGHIALQAEGHAVWFRTIEIKELEKPTKAAKP
jgi:hypothetical protein